MAAGSTGPVATSAVEFAGTRFPCAGGRVLLPNGHLAQVSPTKLRNFLLADSHRVGRHKAAFFRRLGYSAGDWQRLTIDLLEVAEFGDAIELPSSAYGTKYVIRCTLSGRPGLDAEVDTIWIVEPDGIPRFVTAYPAG